MIAPGAFLRYGLRCSESFFFHQLPRCFSAGQGVSIPDPIYRFSQTPPIIAPLCMWGLRIQRSIWLSASAERVSGSAEADTKSRCSFLLIPALKQRGNRRAFNQGHCQLSAKQLLPGHSLLIPHHFKASTDCIPGYQYGPSGPTLQSCHLPAAVPGLPLQ